MVRCEPYTTEDIRFGYEEFFRIPKLHRPKARVYWQANAISCELEDCSMKRTSALLSRLAPMVFFGPGSLLGNQESADKALPIPKQFS